MDELGTIGGLDKTGQGGGSYGGYYLPVAKKQKQSEPPKLKQGEVIIGTILEILDYELAKVKLPMGTFNASLHSKLRAGDTLFLYVAEVVPGLVLRVHSVTSFSSGKVRTPEEVLRIIDLPINQTNIDIAAFLLIMKSNVLRSDLFFYISVLEKLDYENKKFNKRALFKAIFSVLIATNSENIDQIKSFYPAFLGIEDIYLLAAKIKLENSNYIDFSIDRSILELQSRSLSELLPLVKIADSVNAYNRFASSSSLPLLLLQTICFAGSNYLVKAETLFETKTGYTSSPVSSINKFSYKLANLLLKLLSANEFTSQNEVLLNKIDLQALEAAAEFSLTLTHLSIFSETTNLITISDGIVKATPRNFSIVV